MRVAVAGSSGLIGTALVARLREGGHRVVRLVRRPARGDDEISWSPATDHLPTVHLDGLDAVVNLCGVGIGDRRWTGARKQLIRDSRVEPTEVIARAAAAAGVPALINAGAVGYYGDTADRVVDESAPAGSGFLASVCVDWEDAARSASDAGMRVVTCRSGVVLSPRGGMLAPLKRLYSVGLGGRLGSGHQYMSWISLDDEVRAIEFLLHDDEARGPVNITGPAPVTNTQFNAALGRRLHRPAPWIVPPVALRMAMGGFASEAVLAGQRAIPRELERLGFAFRHATIGQALDAAV
ncbi:TIGR01777 family oxidoreductase [Tomitella fengzijianii]|uniref:TIGR01777 family protein n=1 Tax=Tomitella fengzijianii TaxID=2597660 RepID=A0A516X4D2_9ACTN|nr:TIGR01777 family oxidoreductase [Tomitella fengzijianii]QDQ97914.1 TIGR01777 family protein [Tomitella fengzijianii]